MDRRQNNGSVKAVSPRHCAATSALRNCCFNCRAGQSHKDNVRCTAVEERPESERSPTFAAQLHLPAHDLFWANLRVQLHLPPLDLAWNPVQKGMQRLQVFKSRFGLVVWCFCWAGKQKDHPFDSASALLSLQTLWFMDTVVVTLPLTVNETLKWLPQLPILMQTSLWWCQRSNPLPLVVTV